MNLQFDTNVSTTGVNDVPSLATWTGGGQLGYGVANQSPFWIANAHSGGGYRFDGINDTLYVRHPAVRDNFTIMAWFSTNETIAIQSESTSGTSGTSGQHWLLYPGYGNATTAGAGISVGTNGIGVYEHGPAYLPPIAVYNGSVPEGWNHVTVVYRNRQPSIYLNGQLVRTGLRSNESSVYASYELGGAGTGYSWFFNGTLDGYEVLNRSLSAAQVAAVYAEENTSGAWTTIVPDETAQGESWSVAVTTSDGSNSTTALSNNLTIRGPQCGNVSSDITLTSNVSSAGTCFTIAASNVTLDCAEHTITYATNSSGYGIVISQGTNNVTVKNCTVFQADARGNSTDKRYAVFVDGSAGSSNHITNVTVSGTDITTHGDYAEALVGSYMFNSTFDRLGINTNGSQARGIDLVRSDSNAVTHVQITTNGTAAYALIAGAGTTNVTISDSVLNSTSTDLYLNTNVPSAAVNAINTTYNDSGFQGPGDGYIHRGWHVDIHVTNASGDPVSANASFAAAGTNVFLDPTENGTATIEPTGTRRIILYGYTQNYSGIYYHENYTLEATKTGYNRNDTKQLNLTGNAALSFSIANDRSTSAPAFSVPTFTNQNVSLTATVDPDVDSVAWTLLNSTNPSQTIDTSNLTKQTSTSWTSTVRFPAQATYTLRVSATDTVGNTVASEKNVTYDTTAPTITTFTCADVRRGQDPSCTCIAEDASTLKGGTLTASYSADTSLVGTATATCTALDEAGNRASHATSFSVNGGGGSIVATLAPNRVERTWVEVASGQTITLDVNRSALAVSRVTLAAASAATRPRVVVTNGSATFETYGTPSATTYGTFDVSSTLNASRARIGFHVPRGGFDPAMIVLYRYDNGWTAEPTSLVSNGSELEYASEVTGLGTFAIGTRTAKTTAPTVTLEPDTTSASNSTNTTRPKTSGSAPHKAPFPYVPLAAIIAATIIAVAWILTRRRMR